MVAAAVCAAAGAAASLGAGAAEEVSPDVARDVAVRRAIVALHVPASQLRSSAPESSARSSARPSTPSRAEAAFRDSAAGRFLAVMRLPDDRFAAGAEALLDDPDVGGDLRRALRHQLEQLPPRHADRLRGEARYNLAAEGTNAVLSGSVGLLQGNTTVIGRVVLVVSRALGRGPLDPRERKERVLRAAWLASMPPAARRGAEAVAAADRLASLDARWLADERRILVERVGEAARFRRFAEAAFFARALGRVDPDAGHAAERDVAEREARWRRERGRALRVHLAPDADALDGAIARRVAIGDERDLARMARDERLAPAVRSFAALVRAEVTDDPRRARERAAALAALPVSGGGAASPGASGAPLVRHAARWLTADARLAPDAVARREVAYHEARVWHFVGGGRRDFGENAYITAYGAIGGVPGLLNTAVFFGFDTIIRLVSAQFVAPIPPDDAVVALLRVAASPAVAPDDAVAARREAVELLLWAGEPERALHLLEMAPEGGAAWPAGDHAALAGRARDAAAERAFVRVRAVRESLPRDAEDLAPADVVRLRAAFQRIVDAYPDTAGARRAAAARDALPAPAAEGTLHFAGSLFAGGGRWQDLAPVLLRAVGATHPTRGTGPEVVIAGVLLDVATLHLTITLDDGARVTLRNAPEMALGLVARRDEERRIAAREQGLDPYRRQVLPLRLEGGIGSRGVDVAPQLKKLPFRDPDAHLYRR